MSCLTWRLKSRTNSPQELHLMDAGARQNNFYYSAHPNIAKSEHKWIQRTVSVLRKIDKNPTGPLSTESKSQGK